MTLKIKRIGETDVTRVCLSGELRCTHLADLRAEFEEFGQPQILDLSEVDIIDLDGIRLLNEYQALGINVANCSRYIREWMLHEKRAHEGKE